MSYIFSHNGKRVDLETWADVVVVGSGPVGCTFARKLVKEGAKVLMIDAGAQLSRLPGEHLKNSFLYQRNVNLFTGVIKGHLHTLSVPVDQRPVVTLDPGAASFDKPFVRDGQNKYQDPRKNLGASAVSYGVGGMATHWTCACPRLHPTLEWDNNVFPLSDLNSYYLQAEEYLHVQPSKKYPNERPFGHSRRHNKVLETVKNVYGNTLQGDDAPRDLPLACERLKDSSGDPIPFVHWSGSDTILAELATSVNDNFILLPEHRGVSLNFKDGGTNTIESITVIDLLKKQMVVLKAKVFVIAAGAVLTPQILFTSGIRPEPETEQEKKALYQLIPKVKLKALGHYLAEQPMAFCQIVLKQDIVNSMGAPTDEEDPIPVGLSDPEPQVYIPVSTNRPWHCQVHRDAFSYGELAPNVDSRLIVDLRWFGLTSQKYENRVYFSQHVFDTFGMPQPTFEYELKEISERNRQHEMMADMLKVADALGGFMPGSEPQFMTPGLALHIHGTIRLGKNAETSVVNSENSQVWGINNLYLGGNGLLPTGEAANPTLTSVALAIRACEHIVKSHPKVKQPVGAGVP